MGLKLGKVFRSVFKRAPGVVTAFATGGASLLTPGGAMSILKPGGFTSGGIGGGVPSIQQITGVAPLFAQAQNGGLAVPVAAPAVIGAFGIRLMTQNIARAIIKLATILGIPVALPSLVRVGSRLWRTMMTFARRHPAISILSMLTALGLSIEEAGEFLVWGQSKARRRRGRGISARDIRTCRRTMRRMAAFQRDIFRAAPRRRRVGARGDGTIIAQN